MKKGEIKNKLFESFTYEIESGLNIDYCHNCEKFVRQKDRGDGSFSCEYCGSENIEIIEVE